MYVFILWEIDTELVRLMALHGGISIIKGGNQNDDTTSTEHDDKNNTYLQIIAIVLLHSQFH